MDQESFRKLLQKPNQPSNAAASSSSSGHIRGSLLAVASSKKQKPKAADASQPAFKPRTLKKSSGQGDDYRDRAAERRRGLNSDYAQVEALAEDFERRTAENADREAVEAQRKYLGGDSAHTVLVKGLDFALLEQNRVRAAAEAAVTEDVSLEQAFLESSSAPAPAPAASKTQGKRRTREDILRELKSKGKRGSDTAESAAAPAPVVVDEALEQAKKAGKFKPIGFKPVGGAAEGKAKRKKKAKAGEAEENGERKKKRKVAADAAASEPSAKAREGPGSPNGPLKTAGPETRESDVGPSSKPPPLHAREPEPEPVDEDFDIFTGAGEYTGIDVGEDDDDDDDTNDEDGATQSPRRRSHEDEEGELRDDGPPRPRKWLATSDDERDASPPPAVAAARSASPRRRPQPPSDEEEGAVEEEGRPMRLQPLASSVLPSIKDLLAMDDEVGKGAKRRVKKEKKAGGGGGVEKDTKAKDTKAKVDRDYQRLKAYTDKKSKA